MNHTCHVNRCDKRVPPRMLMCRAHWRLVPPVMQRAVYDSYRPGQCDDRGPSRDWLRVARTALNHVARATGVFEEQGE